MPHKTKAQELEYETAKWYKRLKKEGFQDIEQRDGNLKEWHHYKFQTSSVKNSYEPKSQYFRFAGHFLHTYKFASEKEQLIWQLHSEGLTLREVSEEMKRRGYACVSKPTIGALIRKLSKEMLKNVND